MGKIHETQQFFEASGPRGHFFKKKTFFRYGLWECVYEILGPYRFSFGQEVPSVRKFPTLHMISSHHPITVDHKYDVTTR